MNERLAAVIFDLDGVVTDTAEYHYVAWRTLAEQLGIAIDRPFNEQLKGISRMDALEKILARGGQASAYTAAEKTALAEQKNAHYKQLIQKMTPEDVLPGIRALLQELADNKIKVALASASKNAHAIVERLELDHHFDHIVDVRTIAKGKPDPEIFVAAADALGVPYDRCIGIEDAVAGVTAIRAAGMFAVGIGDRETLAHADYVVESTAELTLKALVDKKSTWLSGAS